LAISNDDATLFTMDLKLLKTIELTFPKVYQEMVDIGIIKHKKQMISIH
jgi:hypothetical protein